MRDAMIANASPRLTRNPTLKSVADMPAATPRRTTGTEFMIDGTLGAMNRPPPMPARIIGKTRIEYETPYGSVANQTYDAPEMSRPAVVKPRGPYLSDRNPLMGPMLTKASKNGIRSTRAVSASRRSAPWKQNTRTRPTAPRAVDARRLLPTPAENAPFRKKARPIIRDGT